VSSGLELATFRLAAQCLNQQRYSVPSTVFVVGDNANLANLFLRFYYDLPFVWCLIFGNHINAEQLHALYEHAVLPSVCVTRLRKSDTWNKVTCIHVRAQYTASWQNSHWICPETSVHGVIILDFAQELTVDSLNETKKLSIKTYVRIRRLSEI
jgi:hypothetical protein